MKNKKTGDWHPQPQKNEIINGNQSAVNIMGNIIGYKKTLRCGDLVEFIWKYPTFLYFSG